MKYKALIFDLDGTAIPNAREALPSRRTVEALRKASKSVSLSVASGRPPSFCKEVFEIMDFLSPSILTGGANIVDPKTGEILWAQYLTEKALTSIVATAKPYSYEIYFSTESDDDVVYRGQKITDKTLMMGLFGVPEKELNALIKQFKKIPDIAVHPVISWVKGGFDIHITHENATKRHALEILLKKLAINPEEIIAIGDSGNDLPLFELAGLKVAMGNASEELKSAADIIAPNVEKDGMAEIIEKYILR